MDPIENLNNKIHSLEKNILRQEHSILRIVKNIYQYSTTEKNNEKLSAALQSLVAYILRRQAILILVSVASGSVAIFGCYLAYQSNKLVKEQNDLIDIQNTKIENQTYLQEAERNSAVIFLTSNIMDELGKELEGNKIGKITSLLSARIQSLSQQFKPYKRFISGELTKKPSSPERGYIFTTLVQSNINKNDLNQILSFGNFKYMELNGGKISDVELLDDDFSYSNWKNMNVNNTLFDRVTLKNIDFSKTLLENVKFKSCEIVNSIIDPLRGSTIVIDSIRFRHSTIANSAYRPRERRTIISIKNSTFRESIVSLNIKKLIISKSFFQNTTLIGSTAQLTLEYVGINSSADGGGILIEKDYPLVNKSFNGGFIDKLFSHDIKFNFVCFNKNELDNMRELFQKTDYKMIELEEITFNFLKKDKMILFYNPEFVNMQRNDKDRKMVIQSLRDLINFYYDSESLIIEEFIAENF